MSRASVIAALVAVEVTIVAVAIYAIGELRWNGTGWSGQPFASRRDVNSQARPLALPVAGTAPRVTIDDPESYVTVGVSSDGRVHVTDSTNLHGMRFGDNSIPQLHVTRSGDNISIVRPWHERFLVFGLVDERIEVEVPAGSRVEISRCQGAEVTGISGGVSVHSQDGHVTLTDLQGAVDAQSDDGYIEASNVRGDSLTMHSSNGHLTLHDVAVRTLQARTNDGRVEVEHLSELANGNVASDDGSIDLQLAAGANLTLDASTGDGSVSVDGSSVDSGDSDAVQHTITVGNGAGALRVSTSDGSIHIITNGAQ
jgi:Putative adhesin